MSKIRFEIEVDRDWEVTCGTVMTCSEKTPADVVRHWLEYGRRRWVQDAYGSKVKYPNQADKQEVAKAMQAIVNGTAPLGTKGRTKDPVLSAARTILIRHLTGNKGLTYKQVGPLPDWSAIAKLCKKHKVAFAKLQVKAKAEAGRDLTAGL